MHQCGGGQMVTVRSNINAAGACISSRSDVLNLMQLTHNQATNFIANIQLTTIFLNNQGSTFNVGGLMHYLGVTSELTMAEVADRMIRGLQTGKDNLEIKSRRSLIDFIVR